MRRGLRVGLVGTSTRSHGYVSVREVDIYGGVVMVMRGGGEDKTFGGSVDMGMV